MTDLADFLLARIAEDEEVAQVATAAPWRVDERGSEKERDLCWAVEGPTLEGQQWPLEVVDVTYDRDYMTAEGGCPRREDAEHIARHDPARVLAECDAKRRIVELHQSWPVLVEQAPEMDLGHADTVNATVMRVVQRIAWLTQQEYRQRFGDGPPTTPILRALALPYANHPDYRDEWRT